MYRAWSLWCLPPVLLSFIRITSAMDAHFMADSTLFSHEVFPGHPHTWWEGCSSPSRHFSTSLIALNRAYHVVLEIIVQTPSSPPKFLIQICVPKSHSNLHFQKTRLHLPWAAFLNPEGLACPGPRLLPSLAAYLWVIKLLCWKLAVWVFCLTTVMPVDW